MIGMEFTDGSVARDFLDRCLAEDLLLYAAGLHGEVARFIPPLIITSEQVDHSMTIVARAIAATPIHPLN